MDHPRIIQGGMGAGVSDWRLARAVSQAGQLGVVSGTALDSILARRLQLGDPGGHMRRALEHFPVPEIAQRVLEKYYVEGGKAADAPFAPVTNFSVDPPQELLELTVLGNFAEVWLAQEGHDGPVGINYLEKIQMPHLPSIYGALLAGVDYVIMGAGIPREIPGALDALSAHSAAALRLHIEEASPQDDFQLRFDPRQVIAAELPPLKRPRFLAIVASVVLALSLAKKANGRVDGFIVEGSTAGGHNAPPRGALQLDGAGEPVYGPKDEVDIEKIGAIGLPFWMAGGYASPDKLHQALEAGAAGIQVGTAFMLCEESGLAEEIKEELRDRLRREEIAIFTDPVASPTGFPFKVVPMADSMADETTYQERSRICDLGYLLTPYKREDGSVGYRCASEPAVRFEAKGGDVEETRGRKCLCNGLLANIALPQVRHRTYIERPLVTAGNDINLVRRFLRDDRAGYAAVDVLEFLLEGVNP